MILVLVIVVWVLSARLAYVLMLRHFGARFKPLDQADYTGAFWMGALGGPFAVVIALICVIDR